MKVLLLILIVSTSFGWKYHPVNEEIVAAIKEKAETWTPCEVVDNVLSMKAGVQVQAMMSSTPINRDNNKTMTHIEHDSIPDFFSVHEKWPKGETSIDNQELGGADWALTAASVLTERLCIASNGTFNQKLSANDIISCDTKSAGCKGGSADRAWDYLVKYGIVTEKCYPFESHFGHHTTGPKRKCTSGCTENWVKYYASEYHLFTSEKDIQIEIMENGSVHTEFEVFEDYLNYEHGIYQHVTGAYIGYYSVKILGWGTDKQGVPYWIAANSLGEDWGEKGYFRFLRGSDHCKIESNAVAGFADLSRL